MPWPGAPESIGNLWHCLEPLICGVLLTNFLQYALRKCEKRSGGHWRKWGPAYLSALALVLSMAMPMVVLFINVGKVGFPEWKLRQGTGWLPDTVHGMALYFAKWLGTGCFTAAALQLTRLQEKIARKWRQLQAPPAARAAAAAASAGPPPPWGGPGPPACPPGRHAGFFGG